MARLEVIVNCGEGPGLTSTARLKSLLTYSIGTDVGKL